MSSEGRFWRDLAACVHVAEASGAPLSELLHRYAEALEADQDARAARDGVLAGPQATVRLLAWLPVGGLGLGYMLGADPVETLLDSWFGWVVLAAATVLTAAGRVWSRRLVAAAAGTAPT
ncbi:hypothetical protein BN1051_02444 [Arthrobacter saudimassiliensis]|uniref:Type II secretion system protein GspF domain-containing protein n=1 Tax=Arthrobacter saudimassiliensis TaxID=1461584 RepID=A0A078MW64_9MICC|nr:hypothetical protein BN1051_02444 [Arthrobacter saudimassiliensis]